MPYINFKNPADINPKDWVRIEKQGEANKHKESKEIRDPRGVFKKMKDVGKIIDAGKLQAELIRRGVKVSTDPEMRPNGITVSSAGILIALDTKPNEKEYLDIEDAIEEVSNQIENEEESSVDSQSYRRPKPEAKIN